MLTKKYYSKENVAGKKLLKNFVSLAVLQGSNYILPLLTLPYLVAVLGVEKYGLVVFAQALISYFAIIVDYGFNLSATMEISINRNNPKKLSEIFLSVMLIKMVLLGMSMTLYFLIIFSFNRFRPDLLLYLLTFGTLVGQVFFPVWYFQGLEKMKLITNISICTRLLFTILIFATVHRPNDYFLVPVLNSFGNIVAGIISIYIIFCVNKLRLSQPTFKMIKYIFTNSTQFFLSRVANDGNQNYVTLIIGLSFGNTMVGYYSMIEKLYKAFYSLTTPIIQTIYPYMANTKNTVLFRKIFWVVVPIFSITTVIIIIYNKFIISLIFGFSEKLASDIFTVLFSGSIFGIISSLLGYPLLATSGYIKEANQSLMFAAIISFIYTNITISLNASIVFVAGSLLIYEVIGCSLRVIYVYRRSIWRI